MKDEEESILSKVIDVIQWIVLAALVVLALFIVPSKVGAAPTAGVVEELNDEFLIVQQEVEEQAAKEAAEAKRQEEEERRREAEAAAAQRAWDNMVAELQATPEYRYMCAIIWAEAGNQPLEGQKAVGIVVQNRIDGEDWPDTILEVLYQHNQFQPTWNGQFEKGLYMYDSGQVSEDVRAAATYAMLGYKEIDAGWAVVNMEDYYFFNTFLSNPRLVLWDHRFK